MRSTSGFPANTLTVSFDRAVGGLGPFPVIDIAKAMVGFARLFPSYTIAFVWAIGFRVPRRPKPAVGGEGREGGRRRGPG